MAQNAKGDFLSGTRLRRMALNSIPYVPNQGIDLRLDSVGLLSKLKLRFFFSFDVANAALTYADYRGALAVVKRVELLTNARAQIVSVSGWGAHIASMLKPQRGHNSQVGANLALTAPGAAGAGKVISFAVEVPIALNQGINSTLGLLALQNDDLKATLRITWDDIRNIFTVPGNVSNVTGYCIPVMEYYEVPDLSAYELPDLSTIVTLSEYEMDINRAAGEFVYNVNKGQVIAWSAFQFLNNGSPATTYVPMVRENGNLKDMKFLLQKTVSDFSVPVWERDEEFTLRYGITPPTGVVVDDNLWDTDLPGRFADGVNLQDSGDFTAVDYVFNIQGFTPGSSKVIQVVREFAAVQG